MSPNPSGLILFLARFSRLNPCEWFRKRIQPLSRNPFLWPLAVFRADYRGIISANGLDAYFFVRFLRAMAITLLPIWLLSWAVLLPITAVKPSSGLTGLDKFTFGNVATSAQSRYSAHLISVYIFTCESLPPLLAPYSSMHSLDFLPHQKRNAPFHHYPATAPYRAYPRKIRSGQHDSHNWHPEEISNSRCHVQVVRQPSWGR